MKRKTWLVMLGAGVLTLSAVATSAQVRGRIKPIVLHERECVKECRGDLDECLNAAADDLSECVEPCVDERKAAREACADDPASTACAEARAALRACTGPCLQEYDTAITGCFGTARECIGACPPVDDPSCVRACFEKRAECLADLRAEVKSCRERCREEVRAARRICSDDPDSEECRVATAAAQRCLAPCGKILREGVRECRRETRACLAQCGDDEETPAVDAAQ